MKTWWEGWPVWERRSAVPDMRSGVARVVLLALMTLPVGAIAQETEDGPDEVRARVVEITPAEEDAAVVFDGRRYGGTVRVTGHPAGLAVIESVGLDGYLAGIQEVPFSWEPAALEAQAIAARTYLSWTLSRGRTEAGARYGYDICATDACQVYAGREPALAEGGDRWLEAVTGTGSQILVYEGSPAQTYYSSTSGGRTRTVSDVWPDVDLPYLVAVESPGEESPFAEWSWRLPERHMESLLQEAGLSQGDLTDVITTTTDDGEGPWTVTVRSGGGEETRSTWEMRGLLNRAGPAVLPEVLPARRPDGPRYPQTILSPTFVIDRIDLPLPSPLGHMTIYEVNGNGWGHLVGMSQYGAQAMASEGASAAEILSHYYRGLSLVEAPELVPNTVEVALATGRDSVEMEVTGPVTVSVDGREVAASDLGTWGLSADQGSLVVSSPVGLGLPPRLRPGVIGFENGRLVLRPELTAAAEVTWSLVVDGREVAAFGPERVDAGHFSIPYPMGAGSVELTIEAVNAHGADEVNVQVGTEPDDG